MDPASRRPLMRPVAVGIALVLGVLAVSLPVAPAVSGPLLPSERLAQAEPPAEKEGRDERTLRVEPRTKRTKRTPATRPPEAERTPRAARAAAKASADAEAALARAMEALGAGRPDDARAILDGLDVARLPREKADDASYMRARLQVDGAKRQEAFEAYLKEFARGQHRREATLAMARHRYVEGDYAEAERLLAIFSPGVEKDLVGRDGLILRGLAQLGRGDAAGALQFLVSCERDLLNAPEEEAYLFARSQAAIRAGKAQEAQEALRLLLEKYPQGAYAPQALYGLGVSLEMMGRGSDAANVFRQVAQRFPESYEATRVRDRGIRPGGAAAGGLPIGGGYSLQIGAFSRRDLADALARDLRLAGVPDVTVKQGSETPPIYRVRAGAFASRDEARALGERLRRERGVSSTVVPR